MVTILKLGQPDDKCILYSCNRVIVYKIVPAFKPLEACVRRHGSLEIGSYLVINRRSTQGQGIHSNKSRGLCNRQDVELILLKTGFAFPLCFMCTRIIQ